ncbi:hypothetical protein ACX80J_16490 [Arthrobacter sp. MDB2-24]
MTSTTEAAPSTKAILRLRQEEAGGTAELLLAAPVGRMRWLASYLRFAAGEIGPQPHVTGDVSQAAVHLH